MDRVRVVVDTREQEPYAFDPRRVTVVRRALPAGDYSVEGWEGAVAVERKTLEDFVSTVIRGRARFRKELRRLEGYEAFGRLTAMRAAQSVLRAGRENPEARIDRIEIYGADGKLVLEANLGEVRR